LLLCGSDIDLPAYVPGAASNAKANRITAELGKADGIILGTPGYHGGLSGLVKNALDYTEDLRSNKRPYLEGRPVGCVVTAAGEQGAVTTLVALRSVVHALRGWPTPLGVIIVTSDPVFDAAGNCISPRIETQLRILSQQVVDFALLKARADGESSVGVRRGSAFG
jgi:FMN reductase